jgi:hypothetical protein
LGPIDVRVPLETLGGPFEFPGKNQHRDERSSEPDNDVSNGRITKTERRENGLDDLDNEPSRNDVSGGYANHIAALEFGEKRH